MLDGREILAGLNTLRVGRSVLCFEEVSSTNDVAWDAARQGNTDGLVILAESQRSGRGRHGRNWIDSPGQSILLSVLLMDSKVCLDPGSVTIAAGLAVAQGIESAAGFRCELKWPNDVMNSQGKLAGVLIERRRIENINGMVIGAGINFSVAPEDSSVESPATAITAHATRDIDRGDVIREVLRKLDYWITLLTGGETQQLHDEWMSHCNMIGQRISVSTFGQVYTGRVLDVDPLGALMMVNDHGAHLHIPASSATIVKNNETA